jgi:hypothetical protein
MDIPVLRAGTSDFTTPIVTRLVGIGNEIEFFDNTVIFLWKKYKV